MKSSKFNVYLPLQTKTGDRLIFNSLSKSTIFSDAELENLLVNNAIDKIDRPILEQLEKLGFIVEANLEESRMFNLIHNRVKYNTKTSSFLVLPTFRCNCDCYYCYEGAGEVFKMIMDQYTQNNVIRFIQEITKKNKSERIILGLYGGEPLLTSKACIHLASSVKKWADLNHIDFYSTITTNGTLITPEIVESLILPYLNSIHFTLDGPKKVHDKIRILKDGSGTFDRILQSISYLIPYHEKHLTLRLHFGHNDNINDNLSQTSELLEALEKKGFQERPNLHVYFVQVEPKDVCLSSEVTKDYLDRKKVGKDLMLQIWDLADERGWGGKMQIEAGAEHSIIQYNTLPCEYLKAGNFVIGPTATIYMCPTSAGHTQHSVGKIENNGKITFNNRYYEIITRNPTVIKNCKDCEYLPICSGSCPITAFDAIGNYSDYWCGSTKASITESLIIQFKRKYSDRFEIEEKTSA